MRAARWLAAAALAAAAGGACTVEKKVPLADGGIDAGTPDAPPDDAAPDTTITMAPGPFSRQSAATFVFRSDDPAATFECSIDGAARAACESPFTRALGDGSHTFSVRAIDPSGNGDPTPAERAWTIDTVAPDTTLLHVPPMADNSAMVRFDFRSNEASATFECSLDGAAYAACASGALFGPVGDGPHSFAARAKDKAGNVDTSPAIHAWVADTSTPDTTIVSGPSGPTASASATFTFLSPDAGSGATFECALDGAGFATCTSPRQLGGLGAGAHTFAVRVRDAAGNVDPSPATRAWTVDFTPPDTTIASGPSGTETLATATFTFSADEPDAAFACSLDGSAFAPCASPYVSAPLAQGPHQFAVRAADAAGNVDATPAMRTWVVDTVAPGGSLTGGPAEGSTTGPYVTFAFTASGGTSTCSLDGAPFTACASPVASNVPAGAHQFRVRISDTAGNATTLTRNWTVACAAPSAAGAAALLHLDAADQLLPNAAGGAPAVLGDGPGLEGDDPAAAPGRFGGGLVFSASDHDRVTWPLALGPAPEGTVELWVKPSATGGTHPILETGDGRLAIRVQGAGGTSVKLSATVAYGGDSFRATSGNFASGVWHHVIVSLQEPTLRLWVDGFRTDRDGVDLGEPPSLNLVVLGEDYDGAIDEVWLGAAPITTDDAARTRFCPP